MQTKEEKEEEAMSPTGRMMHTQEFNVSVIILLGYYTKIDPNLYKKCIQQNLHNHPRFSSIPITSGGGKWRWRRTPVVIDDHIFVPDVGPAVEMESPDDFVSDFASNLSETPMDMSKPLWEIYILNLKTSDAESVVVMKVHHSLGDGYSLVALTLACSKRIDDPNSLPVFPTPSKGIATGGKGSGVWAAVARMLAAVWTAMLVLVYTLMDITAFMATLVFARDVRTPIMVARGGVSHRRRFVHRIFSLDDVKLIKTAMNVSINDVMLGVTESGISTYLNTRYEKSRKNGTTVSKKGINNLPRNLRIRSTVVFNLRPPPTPEDLVEMMEKEEFNGKWGNLIAIILLPITIDLQEDPLTYIRRAKSTMDRKKLSLAHKTAFILMKLIMSLFGVQAAARVTTAVFKNTTFTFSNVMGPKEEVNLFGHHLSYISPSITGFPQSMAIHYQSYGDKLILSISADEKLIPNPHQLCDDLAKSLQCCKEAVIKRGHVDGVSHLC